MHHHAFAALAFLTVCLSCTPSIAKTDNLTCLSEKAGSGRISAIQPSGTIILEDSTRLKLVSIVIMNEADFKKLNDNWQGKTVTYHPLGLKLDHLGHIAAHLILKAQAGQTWLQQRLIEEGRALPAHTNSPDPCLKSLLAAENQARREKIGHWARRETSPFFQAADLPALNIRHQGEFTIVRGTIAGIGHSANNLFINFGKNWRQDFTIPIARPLLKRKSLTWPNFEKWIGKMVEVRGWLDHWNGPIIRINHPDALQLVSSRQDQNN